MGVWIALIRRRRVRVRKALWQLLRRLLYLSRWRTSSAYQSFECLLLPIRLLLATESGLVGTECADGYDDTFVLKPIANARQTLTICQGRFNLRPQRSDLAGFCARFFLAPRREAVSGLGNPPSQLTVGIIGSARHCYRQSVVLGVTTIREWRKDFRTRKSAKSCTSQRASVLYGVLAARLHKSASYAKRQRMTAAAEAVKTSFGQQTPVVEHKSGIRCGVF